MNPNHHQGMIYCSNLCTEIAQNMKAMTFLGKDVYKRQVSAFLYYHYISFFEIFIISIKKGVQ